MNETFRDYTDPEVPKISGRDARGPSKSWFIVLRCYARGYGMLFTPEGEVKQLRFAPLSMTGKEKG